MDIENSVLYAAGGVAEQELDLQGVKLIDPNNGLVVVIRVITALTGIQFQVRNDGGPINAACYEWPTGSVFYLTVGQASKLLMLASDAADEFIITW